MSSHPKPVLLGLALCSFVLTLLSTRPALAQAVTSVTVSPSVVAIPTSSTRQTAALVTATVSGLAAGATASCAGTLSAQPSGTTILTSPAVKTSPASTSGTTSISIQFLVPGSAPVGPAQASVTCGGSTATAPFRISTLVGVAVSPVSVPAGGVATVTTMIAGAASLATTPCTLMLTDPSGSAPPLLAQTLNVSGGNATTPASTALNVTLPNSAPLGTANAAVSCVVAGAGTAGDATDFTITDPSVVTVLGFTTPAVVGSPASVTSVTLPGFSCVALFTPPAGARIASAPTLADATGTVVNVIPLPTGLQVGTGTLSVTCADPNNPANSASSAAQVVTLVSAAALTVSATLTNVVPPLVGGSAVNVTVSTSPGAVCSLAGLSSAGTRFPISDASPSGTVPATGSLTISFHLPATIPAGTAIAIVDCSAGGLAASAQVTVPVGAAQGAQNCAGVTSVAASQSSPVADAGDSYTGSAGLPVQFEGSATPSVNAVITSCTWTFGDGSRATVLNPTHVYAAPGTYTATLRITDSAGLSASAAAPVTITGFVPQCSSPDLAEVSVPLPCTASPVCASTALLGSCPSPCASLAAPPALCPQPGVNVGITTNGPYDGIVSQTISFHTQATVSGTRRVCTPDTTLGTGGPLCSLVPADDLPAPLGYAWDFGDGTQATGDTVEHAYGQAGSYTVTVTVYLDDGSTATAATVATISAASPP